MSSERISLSTPNCTLRLAVCLAYVAALGFSSQTVAQEKKKKEFTDSDKITALSYKPKQKGVEYDLQVKGRPSADAVKKLQMQEGPELFGKKGFVLADETNRVLRAFLDMDGDGNLDRYSYFKDGIEVYREVDSDNDKAPNEYRWMGSAGTRWGIDRNQDGDIDQWKVISAEEVAYEVFMAIRNRDDARYQRLLLTNDEFRSLGLTGRIAKDASERLDKARKEFANMVRGQKTIDGSAKWINSGSGQPCIAAAGKELAKDLLCHDHASSVFQSSNGTDTLALGTLVKVGDAWRLMELPQVVPRGKAIENGGVLFPVVQMIPQFDGPAEPPIEPILAGLYKDLTEMEQSIEKLGKTGVQMAKLQKDRAMLQWKIYNKIPEKEKENWVQNMADTVTYAYQEEYYPEGLKFLESVIKTLRDNKKTVALDYVRWRMIHCVYYKRLGDGDKRTRDEATEEYFGKLEKFAKEFPKSEFAAKSLFDIGQHFEVSRNQDIDKAIGWYKTCSQQYAGSAYGKRAAGAVLRLSGRGKAVPFKGKTVDGKILDIANRTLRNRIVVAYFWTTRVADDKVNAKDETAFDVFQDIKSKFKDEVVIVSVNVEPTATVARYENFGGDLSGIFEMHAPGGLEESPLATQLGIVSEPTMIVWDKAGNMFDAESAAAELERIIQRANKAPRAAQLNKKP